jgi:small subunit ribosomal protein S3
MLVAKNIAEQIEDRIGFKIAMKKTAVDTMRAGAKGIKICCSGRLSVLR